MDHRLDALLGFARVVEAVNQLGLEQGAEGRATVGMANIFPNSRNVVPGRVFFSVEFRHPDEALLARQDVQLREVVERIAGQMGLQHNVKQIFQYAPIVLQISTRILPTPSCTRTFIRMHHSC
jgi:N-carbamoyl-L-amino-acid hydrolase